MKSFCLGVVPIANSGRHRAIPREALNAHVRLVKRDAHSCIQLRRAGQPPFTKQLLKHQLKLFQKVACLPDGDILRDATFCRGTLRPATDRYSRKVGRPRAEWATK